MAKKQEEKNIQMSLEQYIEVLIPVIKLCKTEREKNKKGYKRTQLWYLYRQFFYGFSDFFEWETRCMVSNTAKKEYRKKYPGCDIRKRRWNEQWDFDSGHQKGIFHLEHVYTGDMFRASIDSISPSELTVNRIKDIVVNNYYVAWILKDENKKLGKKKRGITIQDALKFYNAEKIKGVKLPIIK